MIVVPAFCTGIQKVFDLSYRYTDDLISFNNKRLKEFISNIYPKELTISESTESTSVASYLENQSSDILQHSQNTLTGDTWLKF